MRIGVIEYSFWVFNWMKNQKCYWVWIDIYNYMIWLYVRYQCADYVWAFFYEMQEWRLGNFEVV